MTDHSDLIERLETPLVMSMFISKNDLYQKQEQQREEAAAALREQQAEIERCHARLEIDHIWQAPVDGGELVRVEIPYPDRKSEVDGIECRDATISGLEEQLADSQKEIEDLKVWLVTYGAVYAARYAEQLGLPSGTIHPSHYDILERCGARMNDFTRAALGKDGA